MEVALNAVPSGLFLLFVAMVGVWALIRHRKLYNASDTHYKCSSPGVCVPSDNAADPSSHEECMYVCADKPYYYCREETQQNMHVRVGGCEKVSHVSPYTSLDACSKSKVCGTEQYFRCDPMGGCTDSTECSSTDAGCFVNDGNGDRAGSDKCLTSCVRRHSCANGVCTDLGFSASGIVGTCAESPCSARGVYYKCSTDPGEPGCTTSTDSSDHATMAQCQAACCAQMKGTLCGNMCCPAGESCCKDANGKASGCYAPGCFTCGSAGEITYECFGNCGRCEGNQCVPQQCGDCETCMCPSDGGACACKSTCQGTCCHSPGCEPYCPTKDNACQHCPGKTIGGRFLMVPVPT